MTGRADEGADQRGVGANPFATLGFEPCFGLDPRELERRYKELSRALHPDRYASAPAAERRLALGRAIEVGEAFRALRDPVRRAEALSRVRGIAVGETSEPKASPAMLMEMMELREELAAATQAKSVGDVGKLQERMQAREADVTTRLARAFDEGGPQAEILSLLGELRYVRRFLEEVSAFEESLLG